MFQLCKGNNAQVDIIHHEYTKRECTQTHTNSVKCGERCSGSEQRYQKEVERLPGSDMNEQRLWIKLKLRVLQLFTNEPLTGSPSTFSATRVASESAMEGLSESTRINLGVSTETSQTAVAGGGGVGVWVWIGVVVGAGGAHSKSRYGFFHFGILVQHAAARKNCRLAESWRWARVRLS